MQNLGARRPKTTLDFTFLTTDADGVPTTLAGTPAISVYKANGTTQSTAGVTLTADFDSVTGLNQVSIVTTDAFYVAGSDYSVVITTGTVDSVSVVGATVATFRLESQQGPRTWFVSSAGSSSNPGTFDLPLDTFANAQTAASPGDTIRLLAGTYTTAITVSKSNLRIVGDGANDTIINAATGIAITCDDGTILEHLAANGNQSGSGVGINATGKRDVVIRDCKASGDFDGIQVWFGSENCRIERTTSTSPYDGLNFSYGVGLICIDCLFKTTANYGSINEFRGAVGTDGYGIFERCTFQAAKSANNAAPIGAIHWSGGSVVLRDCILSATASHASQTGRVTGVNDSDLNAGIVSGSLSGCTITTSNAGTGGAYDIDASYSASSRLMVAGCTFDRSKVVENTAGANVLYEGKHAVDVYDPPTRAELTSDVSTLATAAALTTVGTNAETAATQATTAATDTGTLTSRLTSGRAAKLDSLLDSGSVASSTEVSAVTPSDTPLAERPSAPNRTRQVKRTLGGGLTFAEIVLRVGDANAAWCLDFRSDLPEGTGITTVAAPTFDAAGATATSATRAGDRPSKGEVLLLNGVTAGSYIMTQEVTYGDSQGVQVVEGPVTVKARTTPA